MTNKLIVEENSYLKERLGEITKMEERDVDEHIVLLAKVFSYSDIETLNNYLQCYFKHRHLIIKGDDIVEALSVMKQRIPSVELHEIKMEMTKHSNVFVIDAIEDDNGWRIFIQGYATMLDAIASEYSDMLFELTKSDRLSSYGWSLWRDTVDSVVLNDVPLTGKEFELLHVTNSGAADHAEIYDTIEDFKKLFRYSKYCNISAFMERNTETENYAFLEHFMGKQPYAYFYIDVAISNMISLFKLC